MDRDYTIGLLLMTWDNVWGTVCDDLGPDA